MTAIFLSPSSVFKTATPPFFKGFYVLGVTLVVLFVAQWLFFDGLSQEYLVDQQLAAMKDLTTDELAAAKDILMKTAPYMGVIIGATQLLSVLAQVFLLGLYVFVVAKRFSKRDNWTYKESFAMTSWCYTPWMIASLGLIVLTLSSQSSQLPLWMSTYSSLNGLILHKDITDPSYNFTSAINAFDLWVIFLLALGFHVRLSLPKATAALLAVAPWCVFFGVWAVIL